MFIGYHTFSISHFSFLANITNPIKTNYSTHLYECSQITLTFSINLLHSAKCLDLTILAQYFDHSCCSLLPADILPPNVLTICMQILLTTKLFKVLHICCLYHLDNDLSLCRSQQLSSPGKCLPCTPCV